MKKAFVLLALAAGLLAIPASAAKINVATLRGTVIDNTADCTTCNLSVPHGCFVSLDTVAGPILVHLGADTGDGCTGLVEDDCIEVTGEVVSGEDVSAIVGSYQVEATLWRAVAGQCD
jgi:type 1 fimbria pilin